jgi:two-component system, OmpR family, sensor histidine kinase SenX3
MRISSRRGTIAFFIILGAILVGVAIALNVSWIIRNIHEVGTVILGAIFFAIIIAGLILNTIFLVREIRRNEQHDSFINAVTHELKTPIASIRLYLETLESRSLDDHQRRQFYGIMRDDTDRLLGTVEQVLKAGEAGQKRRPSHPMELEFPDLVQQCLDLARTRYNLPSEALRYAAAPTNGHRPAVFGDPEELRTAISNVLDNAIKYSGGKVSIAVEVFEPDDKSIAVRVSDRGIGIPRGELRRIFKRFYRVRNRAVGEVKGTGLGLFIVRSITRRHGGDVLAESAGEGQGTTVTIRLPRVRVA